MASFDILLDRIDRLLLRYGEAQRRQALLEAQVHTLTLERDSLRSRLGAARSRIDALLDRLPDPSSVQAADSAAAVGSEPGAESASTAPDHAVSPSEPR